MAVIPNKWVVKDKDKAIVPTKKEKNKPLSPTGTMHKTLQGVRK